MQMNGPTDGWPIIGAVEAGPAVLIDGCLGCGAEPRSLVDGCGVVAGGSASRGRSSLLTSESGSPNISIRQSLVDAGRTGRIGLFGRRRGGSSVTISRASFGRPRSIGPECRRVMPWLAAISLIRMPVAMTCWSAGPWPVLPLRKPVVRHRFGDSVLLQSSSNSGSVVSCRRGQKCVQILIHCWVSETFCPERSRERSFIPC